MDETLQKWLNGELTDEDLRKELGAQEANKYIQIANEVDAWTPDNSERLFDSSLITSQRKPQGKVRSMMPTISLSAAAVVVLAVVAYFWIISGGSEVIHRSGFAEVKEVVLPDGKSKVTLSSNSEISWEIDEWEVALAEVNEENAARRVKLRGKALFQVEKGGPFEVVSASGTVEVLGTTFEVDDFEEGMNVICFEGKVAAKPKRSKKRLVIAGGEGYRYYRNRWEDKIAIRESLPAWLQNQTKFEDAPLSQVINSLEKLFDVSFKTSGIDLTRRFTGTIPNDKLEVSLQVVFKPFDITYKKEGKIIVLSEGK